MRSSAHTWILGLVVYLHNHMTYAVLCSEGCEGNWQRLHDGKRQMFEEFRNKTQPGQFEQLSWRWVSDDGAGTWIATLAHHNILNSTTGGFKYVHRLGNRSMLQWQLLKGCVSWRSKAGPIHDAPWNMSICGFPADWGFEPGNQGHWTFRLGNVSMKAGEAGNALLDMSLASKLGRRKRESDEEDITEKSYVQEKVTNFLKKMTGHLKELLEKGHQVLKNIPKVFNMSETDSLNVYSGSGVENYSTQGLSDIEDDMEYKFDRDEKTVWQRMKQHFKELFNKGHWGIKNLPNAFNMSKTDCFDEYLESDVEIYRTRRQTDYIDDVEDKLDGKAKTVWQRMKHHFKELFDKGDNDQRGWMTRLTEWFLGWLARLLS